MHKSEEENPSYQEEVNFFKENCQTISLIKKKILNIHIKELK